MQYLRRSTLYDCRGFIVEPRAVVHGSLVRTDVTVRDHPAFPDGLHAGTERTCDLVIEGPMPSGQFVARVNVPQLKQWLRIEVHPTHREAGRVRGTYVVRDHGRLE